jgi:hypothetical protein
MGKARWFLLILLVPPLLTITFWLLVIPTAVVLSVLYGLDTPIAIGKSVVRLSRAGSSREYASGCLLLVCSLFGLWPIGLLLSSRLDRPGRTRLIKSRRRVQRGRGYQRVVLDNGAAFRDHEDEDD